MIDPISLIGAITSSLGLLVQIKRNKKRQDQLNNVYESLKATNVSLHAAKNIHSTFQSIIVTRYSEYKEGIHNKKSSGDELKKSWDSFYTHVYHIIEENNLDEDHDSEKTTFSEEAFNQILNEYFGTYEGVSRLDSVNRHVKILQKHFIRMINRYYEFLIEIDKVKEIGEKGDGLLPSSIPKDLSQKMDNILLSADQSLKELIEIQNQLFTFYEN